MSMIGIALGIVLLYVGGWELVWAKPENLFFYGKDIYFGDDGIAFRVNNAFYGLRISNRFFDSYVLSWLSLGLGLGAAAGAKFLTKNNLIGEVYGGVGRVFGDNSLGAYPRFGITLGKRF